MSSFSYSCLVNEYGYELGCLAPAILIIIVLSFMRKRVRLRPDSCNGRPALPVPIDFLGDDRKRFIVAFAFGATAAACLNMYFKASATTQELEKTAWSRAFRGIVMTLLYGIINYPYLACLHTEYKIIGYTMGLIYTFSRRCRWKKISRVKVSRIARKWTRTFYFSVLFWALTSSIRLIIDLLLYFGCSFDKETEKEIKKLNLGYLLFVRILTNLPSVLCTFFLVGSYAFLLYRELRKRFQAHSHASFQDIFRLEELQDVHLAGKTEKSHVSLLFSNKLNKQRIPNTYEPWYISLKYKIYHTRTDFKFSTQFLSALVVSFIFVYQLTVLLLMLFSSSDTFEKALGRQTEVDTIINGHLIASVIFASIFSVLQLCFFMRSHRSDVLKTYRTSKGLLPDEILHPKMLVGKSLRFCGYQIGYTAIGLLANVFFALFLQSPIMISRLSLKFFTKDQLYAIIKELFTSSLPPLIIVPVLSWISMILLSLFVFKDHNYPDFSVTINNRRLFSVMSYFFFFLNIMVGLWSGLMRVLKGAVIGIIFLPRLNRTTMMAGYRRFDRGYMAYIGFLKVLVAFKHPVMLCFAQLLIEEAKKRFSGQLSIAERPRISTKALNRWFLTVLLLRNPSLVQYRKQGMHSGVRPPITGEVMVEVPPIMLEDAFPPTERLKNLDVY